MDPARLRAILDVLRDAGVKSAKVPTAEIYKGLDAQGAATISHAVLEVEFEPTPEPITPFVDKSGKSVDLDAGAGPLTRDPDADLESANFKKPPADG